MWYKIWNKCECVCVFKKAGEWAWTQPEWMNLDWNTKKIASLDLFFLYIFGTLSGSRYTRIALNLLLDLQIDWRLYVCTLCSFFFFSSLWCFLVHLSFFEFLSPESLHVCVSQYRGVCVCEFFFVHPCLSLSFSINWLRGITLLNFIYVRSSIFISCKKKKLLCSYYYF